MRLIICTKNWMKPRSRNGIMKFCSLMVRQRGLQTQLCGLGTIVLPASETRVDVRLPPLRQMTYADLSREGSGKRMKMTKAHVPLERDIERYFVKEVEAHGGWAIKFQSDSQAGVPDRIVFWKGSRSVEFVELKRPGGKPRPLQVHVCKKLSEYNNVRVWVLDSYESVNEYVNNPPFPRFAEGRDWEAVQ
nr:MAG TPA_asm: Nuclease [Caudoviricetes sp.]